MDYTINIIEKTYFPNMLSINSTNLFRGIAIIMVILTHAHQPFSELPPLIKNPLSFFQMGAQIFLILSCFGLCISYSSKKPRYFTFIKHRITKLGKGYWIAIACYLALSLISILAVHQNVFHNNTDPVAVIINILLLHGMTPSIEITNYVVFGGWFVGTLALYYVVFPVLYKVYFTNKFTWWVNCRRVLFPLCIQLVCFICVYGIGRYNKEYFCSNDTVIYYNIINQLPCICLGFSLYDLCAVSKKTVRFPMLKSLLFLSTSVFLFFYQGQIRIFTKSQFILLPFIFGCGFIYFYLLCGRILSDNSIRKKGITHIIRNFGVFSFGIYLLHPFFAYSFERFILNNIYGVYLKSSPYPWYLAIFIICLIIVFVCSFWVGVGFDKVLKKIKIHK